MAHVQGALAFAEIIKKFHPKTPVIFGGLSATYYHEEILREYPCVDFVVRGDSTEKPVLQLLHALKGKRYFKDIPNLSWRDETNQIQVNPLTHVPDHLDDITIDYRHIMKKVMRYIDPTGYQPFVDWYHYPVTAVFTCRGCTYHCKTCGGSAQDVPFHGQPEETGLSRPETPGSGHLQYRRPSSRTCDDHRRHLSAGERIRVNLSPGAQEEARLKTILPSNSLSLPQGPFWRRLPNRF